MLFNHINFLNEGEQAEEYKRKKAEEAAKKDKERADHYNRRYFDHDVDATKVKDGVAHEYPRTSLGSQNKGQSKRYNGSFEDDAHSTEYHRNSEEDSNRRYGAELASSEMRKKRIGIPGWDAQEVDAISRNMRRHPDKWEYDKDGRAIRKESSIFESVVFLNE